MTLYHPGKVIAVYGPNSKDVISSGKDVQALVKMWDDNLFTCDVDKKLEDKIKEDDIVLIDYAPISPKMMIPKHVIIKIIKGKTAEKTWEEYRTVYNKKKNEQTVKTPPQPPMQLYG